MRSDFEILRALIRDDALAPVESPYRTKTVVLEEPGHQQQPAYSLRISAVPDDVIAFRADAFPAPNYIFRNDKGECKRADFLVIASDGKTNWILYVEMKRGKGHSEKEITQQLRGAQCLVAYCRAIGQEFWQERRFLKKESYQQRFISVRNIGAQKQPTRAKPSSGRHNAPERMLKINAPKGNLRFDQVVGSPQKRG